jgi:hypothetical protein
MTPHDRRALRARNQQLSSAVSRLEKHPLYASVMVQIAKRSDEIAQDISQDARTHQTPARMGWVLKLFEIQAEGYLRLVDDLQSQKDFIVILDHLVRSCWEQYSAYPCAVFPPIPAQIEPIQERARHWSIQGWERISTSESEKSPGATITTSPRLTTDRLKPSDLEESTESPKPEIATVLFMDLASYSLACD